MSSQLHMAQEHFNSYTQPLINLVSAHILARVRLCFFAVFLFVCLFVCHFYKIKTEEHGNLHHATLLRRFRFYVGENSRTFQDRIVEFKDFSRIFGNPGLFKDNYKIQGLFKTVRTLSRTLRPFFRAFGLVSENGDLE